MSKEWLFRGAVALSIGAHAVLLAAHAGEGESFVERVVKIPVMLEAEPPPPPPPPPPPKPEETEKKKARPKKLAKRIEKVVEGDGLRTGELVDAEVGEYSEEVEAEPPPPPPPPPKPKPKPRPEVDKKKLAREFLARLRGQLMAKKKYPVAAQRMGVTGSVTVSFVVAPDSTFSDVAVKRSSGHDVLDRAALRTVTGLSGHLSRPRELGNVPLKTSVALRYEIHG